MKRNITVKYALQFLFGAAHTAHYQHPHTCRFPFRFFISKEFLLSTKKAQQNKCQHEDVAWIYVNVVKISLSQHFQVLLYCCCSSSLIYYYAGQSAAFKLKWKEKVL